MKSNAPRRPRPALVLATYTFAVFVSAFLLFLVQPMFGKMVLPLLGGSPAVWNTCMLFFQVALLVGYLYAHLSSRWLPVRRQWALHLLLLAAALATLPISLRGAAPEGDAAPIAWLLGLMLVTVGTPFVVLSATGPMLQRWFAHTGHPDAADPYHLYAASNLGSLLALLAYPFLFEPRFRLAEQSWGWMIAFVALVLLLALCGAWGWHARPAARVVAEAGEENEAEVPLPDRPITARDRLLWIALAFVPSTLLLGVTTYITTDLTPAPLFWVLPLALYLLTFTLVFAKRPLFAHRSLLIIQPAVIAAVVIVLQRSEHLGRPGLAIPLHLLGLFVTAMVCHGELARRRPAVRHLTEFYLWISVGGALGGVFNVLVAPVLFSRLWEYPLALVLACLLRPWPGRVTLASHMGSALRAVGLGALLVVLTNPSASEMDGWVYLVLAVVTIYLIRMTLGRSPLWLAVCIGGVVTARYVVETSSDRTIHVHRSFYGQYRVNRPPGFTALQHGSTLHGAQSLNPERRYEPLTYYLRIGPFGELFSTIRTETPLRVGVVGLGTGTTAAYAAPGEEWTFYEIDPAVERIARDPRFFTYLADSPAENRVVLGDARLSLERDAGREFDLLVLDAFSSDAIPMHLLTREAFDVYLSRLARGGRIAIHISNRYLELEPVVEALARDRGLLALVSSGPPSADEAQYENSATWVVLTREVADFGPLLDQQGWRELQYRPDLQPWSDDFSSLWPVMRW